MGMLADRSRSSSPRGAAAASDGKARTDSGQIAHPAYESIDLTPYATAVNGALAHRRPAFVATSGEDGTPDIGPKGSVFVADAGHLAYLEYTGGGHLPTCGATLRSRLSTSIRRRSRATSASMEKRSCSRLEL